MKHNAITIEVFRFFEDLELSVCLIELGGSWLKSVSGASDCFSDYVNWNINFKKR